MGTVDRPLLVVVHSRSGTTAALTEAAVSAAVAAAPDLPLRRLDAFDAGPDDVQGCAAVLVATPARFGWMSGAMKDFFERIYHPCLEVTVGLPYALIVKGDTDVEGAVASVERIATGLRWRQVLAPVRVVGPVDAAALEAASELGATLAAGVDAGIF